MRRTPENQPKPADATNPSTPTPAPQRQPAPRARPTRGTKRALCWVALGGLLIAAALIIDPLNSTASERFVLEQPRPIVLERAQPDNTLTQHSSPDNHSAHLSEGSLQGLGSLEGLSTTVWFYAGIQGPMASLYTHDQDPIEQVTLEELYRLAPELRLDTGISMFGEVPVETDHWSLDW